MIGRIIFLLILPFILSSCTSDSLLKKSANNQYYDSGGFHSGKRRPLYNKKYISKAKHNIARSDFDDEEYDEDEQYMGNLHPSLKNRYMYEDMVEEDMKSEKARRAKKRKAYMRQMEDQDRYHHLGEAKDRIREDTGSEGDKDLKRELSEIKSMLNSARKDLVKYRCPIDEDGEIIAKKQLKHEVKPKKIEEVIKKEAKPAPKKASPPKKSVIPKAAAPKAVKPEPKIEPLAASTKPSQDNDSQVASMPSRMDQNNTFMNEDEEPVPKEIDFAPDLVSSQESVPSLPQFPLSE